MNCVALMQTYHCTFKVPLCGADFKCLICSFVTIHKILPEMLSRIIKQQKLLKQSGKIALKFSNGLNVFSADDCLVVIVLERWTSNGTTTKESFCLIPLTSEWQDRRKEGLKDRRREGMDGRSWELTFVPRGCTHTRRDTDTDLHKCPLQSSLHMEYPLYL